VRGTRKSVRGDLTRKLLDDVVLKERRALKEIEKTVITWVSLLKTQGLKLRSKWAMSQGGREKGRPVTTKVGSVTLRKYAKEKV